MFVLLVFSNLKYYFHIYFVGILWHACMQKGLLECVDMDVEWEVMKLADAFVHTLCKRHIVTHAHYPGERCENILFGLICVGSGCVST